MAFTKTLQYSLVAGVTNGIAQSQSGTAATKLTLNGSLVSGGVAVFDTARRVIVTSAGNDSGITFAVVGTDRYGRPLRETLAGTNITPAAQTSHDFATVSSITPSGNTAGAVTSGTNSVGSSAPWVVDGFANPSFFGGSAGLTGSATYVIEGAYDDLSPQWDVNANTPVYYPQVDGGAGAAQDFNFNFGGTLLRLTILSGTGTVTAKLKQSYAGKTAA